MRFSLYFDLKHETLPAEMNRTVISFIKNALSDVNEGRLYESLFTGATAKPYTFAVLLDKPVFENDRILVARPICKVDFSVCNDHRIGFMIMNAFLAQKGNPYPLAYQNEMVLTRVQMKKEKEVADEKILIQTVTGGGICVREHQKETNKDIYFSEGSDDFATQLNRIIQVQVKSLGFSEDIATRVHAECVKGKMVIVRHFGMQIPVTIGYFTLTGPIPILRALVEMGIGSRRSQGFGMVDLITL